MVMTQTGFLALFVVVLPVVVHCRTPFHRIIGGEDAKDGAWPWQVSLYYLDSHSCGASLISSKAAVSAAHCVGSAISSYSIIAGTNQRSCPNSQCVTIIPEAIARHPNYTESGIAGYPNDVSVLSWTNDIEFSAKVQPISITTSEDWVDKECYVTGWGRTAGTLVLPENLQEALVNVLTQEECQAEWQAVQIREIHVCAYDKVTQSRGSCSGDSGGPLVCRASAESEWELIGVVSWGRTGCSTTFPDVYTRLSYYLDWINENSPPA